MRLIPDLVGTLRSAFRVGRASLDSSALTQARTHALPDKSGTFALTSDVSSGAPLTVASGSTFFVPEGQTLYDEEIEVDGEIECDGLLTEVN